MAFIEDSSSHYIIDILADFIFIIDVFVTSISAFYDEDHGQLITNNKIIFARYLRGWLLIDLFASFPVNILED